MNDFAGRARRMPLRHNMCQTTVVTTSRATPLHRQNRLNVALFTSDYQPETGNYKDPALNCQVNVIRKVKTPT